MKNPALPAILLLVLGGATFGVAWWLDADPNQGEARPLDRPAVTEDTIVPFTPREQRRAEKLKSAEEELAHYKEIGEMTDWGAIKVPDVEGHYFVKPELVTGVGRYGEPIYGIARYKRRAVVPLVERRGQEQQNALRVTGKQEKRLQDMLLGGSRETAPGAPMLTGTLDPGAVDGGTSGGASTGKKDSGPTGTSGPKAGGDG